MQWRKGLDRMRSMPADKHCPAHRRIHPDDGGRIWVQDYYRAPRAERGWTVFDASGRMVGRLIVPAQAKRFEVVGFGAGR